MKPCDGIQSREKYIARHTAASDKADLLLADKPYSTAQHGYILDEHTRIDLQRYRVFLVLFYMKMPLFTPFGIALILSVGLRYTEKYKWVPTYLYEYRHKCRFFRIGRGRGSPLDLAPPTLARFLRIYSSTSVRKKTQKRHDT